MAVPYTFGTATAAIPLSQLDSNFSTTITIGNTAVQLGNTITAFANVSLVNATVTSLASPITAAQGGTGLATLTSNNVVLGNGTGNVLLVAPGTSGNALVSNGTTWSSSAVTANVSSVTGILPVSNGGTGASSLTANNVLLGNGTSAVQIVAPGTSGNVLTSNGTSWSSTAPSSGGSVGLDYGFLLSNNATTPNTKLDIAAGSRPNSTFTTQITGTAFTKSTAGSWVAGSGNNGMGTGLTIAANTWYHVFAIIKSSAYDVYFDTSPSAANAPASTTAFRYIGSFLTTGGSNITTFKQTNQEFAWTNGNGPFELVGTPTFGSSTTLSLSGTPTGFKTFPLMLSLLSSTSTAGDTLTISPVAGGTVNNGNGDIVAEVQVAGAQYRTTGRTTTSTTPSIAYWMSSAASSNFVIIGTLSYTNPSVSPQAGY